MLISSAAALILMVVGHQQAAICEDSVGMRACLQAKAIIVK